MSQWKPKIACEACRRAHQSCDGSSPCSRCTSKALECVLDFMRSASPLRSAHSMGILLLDIILCLMGHCGVEIAKEVIDCQLAPNIPLGLVLGRAAKLSSNLT